MSRTVAIIQARMGSTRLPGKVLMPVLGEPMLTQVVRRVARASRLDEVIVATTGAPSDDVVVGLAVREGWLVARGSETDLLDRYVMTARGQVADIVVRITSDCPLVDPEVIDRTVDAFNSHVCDYASTSLEPRSYPRGLDVEVISMAALERAWREDHDPAWREHATPYIYRHPESFHLLRVPADVDRSAHRWSVDTPEDLELVRRIYEAFGRDDFSWQEALSMVETHLDWMDLNSHVVQKTVPDPSNPLD